MATDDTLETAADEEKTGEQTTEQTGEEAGKQGEQSTEKTEKTAETAEDKSKTADPEWLQKRIDRAVRRQHEAEREAAVLRQIVEHERQNTAQRTQQTQVPTTQEDFDKLTPAQQSALVAAEVARRAIEAERASAAQRAQDEQRGRAAAEIQKQAQKQLAVGSKKYEDFEEVALSEDVPISAPMAEAIAESEYGADIAYFLGKNVKEAERIARMQPYAAAREIGRLEAKFAASTTVSKAPAPGKTVGARGGASGGLRDDMPLSEWMATFDKQMRGR